MLIDLAPAKAPPPAPTAGPRTAAFMPSAAAPTVAVVVSEPAPAPVAKPNLWLVGGAAALLLWAYLPTLDWMFGTWVADPQYSHGFLVPLFSGFLLWRKWKDGHAWLSRPRPVMAAGVFAAALGGRELAGGLLFHQLDAFCLLLSLAAVALAVGGHRLLTRSASAVGFLAFMVPLTYEMEHNIGGPLRVVATQSSTFLLQTLGYPAVAEGNTIHIDDVPLEVAEACSGLKMLATFTAFAVGAILVLDRTWAEKLLVLLGIVPIAVASNVLRITATGVVFTFVPDGKVRHDIHDWFGLAMILVGLGFLALQLWVLSRLIVRPAAQPAAVAPTTGPVPAFA